MVLTTFQLKSELKSQLTIVLKHPNAMLPFNRYLGFLPHCLKLKALLALLEH